MELPEPDFYSWEILSVTCQGILIQSLSASELYGLSASRPIVSVSSYIFKVFRIFSA